MSESAENDGKITCQIDGARVHTILGHIKDHHPDWTLERYKAEFPGAPLMSEKAKAIAQRKLAERKAAESGGAITMSEDTKKPFHEVFSLGEVPAAMSKRGTPIMITVRGGLSEKAQALVPDVDENYVFNIELTKTGLMALELNMPAYFWGYHGTGKTTAWEQICARTNTPFMRVQHTINTEEAHIIGQFIVKSGEHGPETVFNLGPLAIAMKEGYVYCADEYDFAMPSVLSVYQPVLEGKPLVIKDAPPEFRVIRPHPNFRFVATGNTNGGGDETGLYQGTQLQNAANYSRFGIVEEVGYMEPKIESAIIAGQAKIDRTAAEKLVTFANDVRTAFKGGRVGSTISPRELINAAKLGRVRGSDWKGGLKLAYSGRLSRVDKEVIDQFAQRVFG